MILAYIILVSALASVVCPVSAYLCHAAQVPVWAGIIWGLWVSLIIAITRWLKEPESWKKLSK